MKLVYEHLPLFWEVSVQIATSLTRLSYYASAGGYN
jgi:hypothetical protein